MTTPLLAPFSFRFESGSETRGEVPTECEMRHLGRYYESFLLIL